jgi:hypothetical protein
MTLALSVLFNGALQIKAPFLFLFLLWLLGTRQRTHDRFETQRRT